jgi:exodeoxyribonuclease VII large subunit
MTNSMFTPETVTVSELTNQIKSSLEENFSYVSVIGEISNFKPHVSGHWYFSIKDSKAVLYCTMWKGFNDYVFFTPQDGMKVIVNGKITVYPPRGSYQLDVRSMKPAGAGELQAAFELLKQKLSDEGLFDEENKKPIPQFPSKIGVITAIDSAAFRDMVSIAQRRFPLLELVVVPARVQGSGASESIVQSLRQLNERNDIDVIIVARGGGSIEDLWAFNEEIVAREIFKSKIPVISGVGHEIDFTIADFVSDMRAPTPSAAMELATPKMEDIVGMINYLANSSSQKIFEKCHALKREVINSINSYGFRKPHETMRNRIQWLDGLIYKFLNNFDNTIKLKTNRVGLAAKSLESHNVESTLRRGFVLVSQDSKFVTRSTKFNPKSPAVIKFYDNELTVIKKN